MEKSEFLKIADSMKQLRGCNMKQLKIIVEIADVRPYGTLDNVGKANLVIDYSSEAFLKTARDLVTEEALSLLINAAKDAHFELTEKSKEDKK